MEDTNLPPEGTNQETPVEVTESTIVETGEQQSKTYSEDEFKQVLARAKKAEEAEKLLRQKTQPAQQDNAGDMSKRDLYALMNAKVHEEDVDEVSKWAKFKNITVTEALKDSVMKTLLRDKEEKRKMAQVANTSGGRPTTSKLSDEALLDKAQKGNIAESDIQRLWKVRRGLKG